MIERRNSKKVKVGNIYIGGDSKITVQSMLNIPAHDSEGNVRQALELEKAGCEIIRLAVPDMESVATVKALKEALSIPLNASWGMDACTYTNGGTDTKRPYFIFKSNKNLPLMKDMGIESILLPSQSTQANTPSSIQVSLRNMGMTTINGVTIYYSIDGGPAQSYQWFGSLAGQTSTPVTITTTAQFTPGFKRIKAWVGDTLEIGSVSYIDHEPLNDTIENTFIACDGPMSGVRYVGGTTPDYANIDEVIKVIREINPDIKPFPSAGISKGEDCYNIIKAGASASGCSSAIAKAENPLKLAEEMMKEINYGLVLKASQLADKAFRKWLKAQEKELSRQVSYLLDKDKRRDI